MTCVAFLTHTFVVASAARVRLHRSDFHPTIVLNRKVTITSSGSPSGGTRPVLNFDHGAGLCLVSCAATVASVQAVNFFHP